MRTLILGTVLTVPFKCWLRGLIDGHLVCIACCADAHDFIIRCTTEANTSCRHMLGAYCLVQQYDQLSVVHTFIRDEEFAAAKSSNVHLWVIQ